ncbi:Hsp20/alpha crystallin family protein [Rariglobus hedericola]|uniref:Hsp20/alpha crystallin family protein n=1 Tax=Rariglobus hedericola TaxID=2597822 RepID=A0A556QRE9_9BACT|nr:Hsp20/alpha crystallin family protein [Rariglobus hedericola]TSJ79203.1 Hsp20/alpha crystallin family protein [Rariglobus hedericola]
MSLLSSFLPSSANSSACAPGSACGVTDQQTASVRPTYRLDQTAEAYTVTVNLPGVTKDNLTVDAEDGVLTVTGRRSWQKPGGWTALYRESADAGYTLSLAYDDAVDTDKISAALTDGVLRLTLPKAEARKPRKIAVA